MFLETKSRETSGLEENIKLTSFPREHTLVFYYIFIKQSYSKNNKTKTACGQQLRKCIPVGIHSNLIRGT